MEKHNNGVGNERGEQMIIPVLMAVALAGAGTVETETEYTDNDLYVLSHIISAEAGNCGEEMLIGVGSVVLNRVASDKFPDTIEEVVFQPGQYAPTWNGAYYDEPTDEAVEVAEMLLKDGSQYPEEVIWQSNVPLGEIYKQIEPPPGIGSTMYFCK